MPLSYQNYTGDNATTQFSIPFTYQNTTEISVTVDGVAETGLTFPSSSTVQLTSAPASGAIVQVRRTTDLSARAVDFASGSVLTEEDLDDSAIQVFHAAQESKDVVNDTITLDTDLKWEADNKVIKNVANPVNLQDAATKNYIENTWLTTSDKAQLNSLSIPNLNSVATNITDVTTVANNISDVNAFAQVYRSGPTDPTTSLDVGDLFYNTTSNLLKIWSGSSWETGVAGASGLLSLSGGTMTGSIAFSGSQTVDGRDVSTDGAKLDLIEAAADVTDAANVNPLVDAHLNTSTATVDQVLGWTGTDYDWVDNDTGVGDLVAANNLSDLTNTTTARTNLGVAIGSDVQAHSSVLDGTTASFTTAEESKLAGIEAGATADQTNAEIRAAVEAATDSNVFTDADHSKLNAIEAGATADQTASEIRALVESATDSNVFTDADHTKLNGIEAGANVTDTTNVTAAGALMDSEVTNLAQVKAFDSSDYATAAQGTLATNALPKSGGAMTGAITTNSTFDGRDVSVDGAKLDGIEAGATADQTASEIRALVESATDSNVFTDADHTKLNNVSTTELYGENPVSATTPTTTGNNDLAIGSGAEAIAGTQGSGDAIAIGTSASSEKAAVAIGKNTDAGQYGVAIGSDDLGVGAVADSYNIAIGGGDGAASATGGTGQIAIGESAASTNNFFGTAIGQDSLALGNSALALNRSRAHSTGEFNTAINIGNNTATYGASGGSSFAAGLQAKALSLRSTALGYQADATGENTIAIGSGSTTTGAADGLAIGTGATAGQYSTAIGRGSIAGQGGVAVGAHDTTVNTFAAQASLGATAVGNSAKALGLFSNAFGFGATAATNSGTALGKSYATGVSSLAAAIGNNGTSYGAQGFQSIALGYLSKTTASNSISIGNRVVNSTANSIAIGGDGSVSGNVETVKISGAYNLPTTDGTSGQVMTTDGSGTVSFTTVSGGGGGASTEIPILAKTASYTVVAGDAGKVVSFSGGAYTATLTAAATLGSGFFCYIENNAATGQATHTVTIDPNASETIDGRTTFIVRQGERVQLVCDGSNFKLISSFHRGIATNMRTDFFNPPQALGGDSIAIGLGTIAGVGNTSNGIAIGTNAQAGSGALALGPSTNAGSSSSTALGKNSGGGGSVTATGSAAMALGGSYASGSNSFAAAIASNSANYGATGANSIAMGNQAKASSSRGVAIGAYAESSSTSIALNTGWNNMVTSASGANSVAIGGNTSATSVGSFAFGQQSSSAIRGKYAYAAGQFAAQGDAQGGQFILRADTTDATATALTTNNATAAADNQIVAASDTCIMFSGTLVAMQNGAQDQGGWEIKGLLKNDGGTTTLVSSNIQTFADGNGWTVGLTADNTNNALAITCTGEAAHNIRWVANISTSEVTYA